MFGDLVNAILSLSREKHDFKEACKEWMYTGSTYGENACLCGHPIVENCYISNMITGKTAVVGNVCVTQFLAEVTGMPSTPVRTRLFEFLRRLHTNPDGRRWYPARMLLQYLVDETKITSGEANLLQVTVKGLRELNPGIRPRNWERIRNRHYRRKQEIYTRLRDRDRAGTLF